LVCSYFYYIFNSIFNSILQYPSMLLLYDWFFDTAKQQIGNDVSILLNDESLFWYWFSNLFECLRYFDCWVSDKLFHSCSIINLWLVSSWSFCCFSWACCCLSFFSFNFCSFLSKTFLNSTSAQFWVSVLVKYWSKFVFAFFCAYLILASI